MKTCKNCNQLKAVSEFYSGQRTCKSCVCKRMGELRAQNILNPEWLIKERARGRRNAERRRKLGLGKNYPHNSRAWAQRNQHKLKAQRKAAYALKKGRIHQSGVCLECRRPAKTEMHHPDYSKPLEIVWLCTKCHGETRRK